MAIQSSLLDVSIDGARSILFNIKGGDEMSLFEVNEAAEIIRANTHPESNIIFGAVLDPEFKDQMTVTVIATGFDRGNSQEQNIFSERFEQPSSSENLRPLHTPESEPQKPPTNTEPEQMVRTFAREDLDIPAFLRRNRNSK